MDDSTLQKKGRWESNIDVWFPFKGSQKWICYFQNRIIMFCLPVPTLIYLWEIYIFPGSVCLFCCREICGPILGNIIAHRHLIVEIGTKAVQFPEKEYIKGIFLAVQSHRSGSSRLCRLRFLCRRQAKSVSLGAGGERGGRRVGFFYCLILSGWTNRTSDHGKGFYLSTGC